LGGVFISKRVCILGTAKTLKDAPLGDKRYEFWALNDMFKVLPDGAADRWFQIHTRKVASEPTKFSPEGCLEWCKLLPSGIYAGALRRYTNERQVPSG
jgi:hypothetical protein